MARNAPFPSPYQQVQDEWQRRLWRTAGLAIGQWLEERGRLHQPIRSLQLNELEGMAWSAISAWLAVRETRRIELNLLPAPTDPRLLDPMDSLMI
jgi:hypothetical protein